MDTARLAFGTATVWPARNSFFDQRDDGERQTREVLAALSGLEAPQNLMLVTHQVNITALTGANPSPGEIIIARPPSVDAKALAVAGSILIP